MNRIMYLLSIWFIVSCISFLSKGEVSFSNIFETQNENIVPTLHKGEIDKEQAYLDRLVWQQMMVEAERVSPKVAKLNYSKKPNTSKVDRKQATSESFSVNTMSAIPSQTEYDALMDFYQAMGGSNWFNKTGWSTANPNVVQSVSNFHGVTLDANGHVKWLILYQNNLNGTIPESFGNLTYLEHIQLVRNPFIGQLPQSIGNLDKVVELLLYSNNMTGTIPETIGNMTALGNVHLYVNNLTGSIPTSITNLPNLYFFSVYDNDMSGTLPADLGNLTKLTHFYINGNSFTGSLPSSIGNLTKAKELYLYSNQLTGSIPTSMGNLTELTRLYLSGNQLSGTIPSSFGNLKKLEFLWMQDNELSGQIPATMGEMSQLNSLFIYRNNLSGYLPASMGNLSNLWRLRLQENQIQSLIPGSFGNLLNLRDLYLSDNKLFGTIPPGLCSLPYLNELNLHGNNLEGDIPNCLYDKNMYSFTVRYNHYNFEELTYAKSKVGDYYLYAPQLLKFIDTLYVAPNTTRDLTIDDGNYQGSPSSYRWKKNNVWMHDASPNNKVISITCNSPANPPYSSPCEGVYYLEIVNPDFVGPHLTGNVFYVKIAPALTKTICATDDLNQLLEVCV